MTDLKQLIPNSTDHSISEVIVNFHLVSKIEAPEVFLTKFKKAFPGFSETGLIFSRGIQIKMDKEFAANFDSNESKVEGFFAKKITDGKATSVIQTQNILPANFQVLSFHFLAYKRWDAFLVEVIDLVKKMAAVDTLLIKSIGLVYVDLFDWKSNDVFPIEAIFSKKTEYLSEHFFSYKGDFLSTNVGIVSKENEHEYVEKYQIATKRISDGVTKLEVLHNVILELKSPMLLTQLIEPDDGGPFKAVLNHEHALNKKFIGNIFNDEIKKLIHII